MVRVHIVDNCKCGLRLFNRWTEACAAMAKYSIKPKVKHNCGDFACGSRYSDTVHTEMLAEMLEWFEQFYKMMLVILQ